jgi:hypothetical protein
MHRRSVDFGFAAAGPEYKGNTNQKHHAQVQEHIHV